MKQDRALVLFSGGQDSSIALAWALEQFQSVETIAFDYGQRHEIELAARETVRRRFATERADWAGRLGPDHLVDLGFLSDLGSTAMTDDVEIAMTSAGLPNTFVPGRNIAFFTAAAALAYRRGIKVLVGGMCETDYSGYPDCRSKTLASLQETLSLAMDSAFRIETPLMFLTKAASWRLAEDIGGPDLVEIIVEESHTCYLGERTTRHAWGYGCGTCPACELRAAGWQDYKSNAS